MDDYEIETGFIIAVFLYLRLRKNVVQRRYWMHPINSTRFKTGHFYLKHPQIVKYPDKFFNYYRMSFESFNELNLKLKNTIVKTDTVMRAAIPLEEMVALTLR